MKCIGELKNISLNWVTKKPEVTLEVDAMAEDIEKLKDEKLSVELKRYRKKRSLEANAYYWVLCSQIAAAMGQPEPYVHNFLLRRYGQPEIIDGQAVYLIIPDTDEAAAQVDEAEMYHLKPTSEVKAGNDGINYRTYKLLKGSHEYNTWEMSKLIDGTIKEAKALGIETITPDQLRDMMASYEKYHAGRQD